MYLFFQRCLIALFFALVCGCGGGGGGDVQPTSSTGGALTSGTIVIEQVLLRSVPSSVNRQRCTGYDSRGSVRFGPQTFSKGPRIELLNVSTGVTRLQIEYLQDDIVVGLGLVPVVVAAGRTTVVTDPPFDDVNAVLENIVVTPAESTIAKGTGQKFTATGNLSDGTQQDLSGAVAWSSSSTAIATVSNTGLATGAAPGVCIISASLGNKSSSAELTVTPATIASIAVIPNTPSIADGTTQQFAATATLTDNSTQDVTATASWTSSNTAAATVDGNGLATSVDPGGTTITATVGAVSGQATLTVTPMVTAPPTAVDDSYRVLGNAGLLLSASTGPLSNDLGVGQVTNFQASSSAGGQVALTADGQLSYSPPFGYQGADTFFYEISNASGSSQATVSITVDKSVKFVDNSAPVGGDGSLAHPFDSLSVGLSSVNASQADFLFIFRGDGTSTGLTGSFSLQSETTVLGEGVGLDPSEFGFDSELLIPAGEKPQIVGQLVLTGDDCDVRGLAISTTTDRSCLLADGIGNVTLVANKFSGGVFANVLLENVGGAVLIEQNEVNDSSAFGIAFESQSDFVSTSSILVQGNSFNNSTTAAIYIRNRSEATLDYTLQRNQFTDVGPSGGQGVMLFESFAQTQGNQTIRVVRNDVVRSLGRFIGYSCSGTLTAKLIVDNNVISEAAGATFVFSAGSDSNVEVRLLGNVLPMNSIMRARANAEVCARFEGNSATSYSFIREDTSAVLNIERRDSFQALNTGTTSFVGGVGTLPEGSCLPGEPLQ